MNIEKKLDILLDSLEISSKLKIEIRLELERIKSNPDIFTYTELKRLDSSTDQSPFESDETYIKNNALLMYEANNSIKVEKIFVYFINKVLDEEE